MIRRLSGPELAVETVVWPGVHSPGAASGGPALQPAGQPARRAGSSAEGAEFERRAAELERARQLETAEARAQGVEEGLRRAREEAAGEVQRAFEQVARTLDELTKVKRKLRLEAEQELVQLSLAVARRILYRELATDPSAIAGVVHAALAKLEQREVSRVKVYPAGVAAVRAALERAGSRAGIEVVADPSLAPGGLLFETSAGELDASFETQLQEIQRGFADRLAIP